ncbi:MAG: hypothetical protein ACFCD0_10500 [Gemmataceae bacterium]
MAKLIPLVKGCIQYCDFVQSTMPAELNAASYRSGVLNEAAQQVFPQSCHTPFSTGMAEAFSQYLCKRITLVSERELLKEVRVNVGDPLALLLVNWRLSLFDGACSPETYDYLDHDCMPGWDTWLGIVKLDQEEDAAALLCWIPSELCREVDSAIAVDAAACMSWLSFDLHYGHPQIVGWGQRWPRFSSPFTVTKWIQNRAESEAPENTVFLRSTVQKTM